VSVAARAANAVIQIGSLLLLARILSPEDYGLVAMCTAITGFATVLVDLGTRDAIAQRARITDEDVSTLFWLTVSLGCVLTLMMAASGPLIARLYGEPRLVEIAAVSSLMFVTTALSCQHYALLRRAMLFEQLAVIDMVANLGGATVAVVSAFAGLQYWALAIRPLATNTFLVGGVWLKCRWVPGRPQVTKGVKEMLQLGTNLTGFSMVDFVAKSSDRVAIGYGTGAAGLGFYQNAMMIYDNLIDIAVTPLHGVAISTLSKLRHDLPELRRLWSKAVSMLAFYCMPAFGLVSLLSSDGVALVLGQKWRHAGVLLSVLALRGIPHVIERSSGWLHVTAGRTDRWMRYGIVAALVQFTALLIGLPYGPMGVVSAYVAAMFLLCLPAVTYAGRPLQVRTQDIVAATWRPLVGTLFALTLSAALGSAVLVGLPVLVRLPVQAATYVGVYLLVVVLALGLRTPLHAAWIVAVEFLPGLLPRVLRRADEQSQERV